MDKQLKSAIKNYQCAGCVLGPALTCFQKNQNGDGCGKHVTGTVIYPTSGSIFLGLPKGFCRLGRFTEMQPNIYQRFEDSDWTYSKWDIPVWKYLNEKGHTLVRGIGPRNNAPFLHIFLEDCRDKIDCLEITQADVDFMN